MPQDLNVWFYCKNNVTIFISRYKPPYQKPERAAELKKIIVKFCKHQDYNRAMDDLVAGGFLRQFLRSRTTEQEVAIKEHVCAMFSDLNNFNYIFLICEVFVKLFIFVFKGSTLY